MKKTIGICDLNAAIAAKDINDKVFASHTEICLLAQFVKRLTGLRVVGSTYSAAAFDEAPDDYPFKVSCASDLVRAFDQKRYAFVRSQLPREVEVSYAPLEALAS